MKYVFCKNFVILFIYLKAVMLCKGYAFDQHLVHRVEFLLRLFLSHLYIVRFLNIFCYYYAICITNYAKQINDSKWGTEIQKRGTK